MPLYPSRPASNATRVTPSIYSAASEGRAKETAVPQAAQSAASGVRTRRLLFANSVGFSALMSARFSFCPGK